ncbi:tocopherol cyclase family protein [Anaerolineales bacterium]
MFNYWNLLQKPELYHGANKKGPFFEGWYYKLVSADEKHKYAFIPGIFINKDPSQSIAFIQIIDGISGKTEFIKYPIEQFQSRKNPFSVSIASSKFELERINLDIQNHTIKIKGELSFSDLKPWSRSILSPGIMGPFAYIPNMECNHGVLSLDHLIKGELEIDNELISFTGGRGYIEKDWGKSFPSAYIWQQTNHFEQSSTSLTASIAIIPSFKLHFNGFIIGLLHNKNLYRFATYTGAKVAELSITDEEVSWIVRSNQHELSMKSIRGTGGMLIGPQIGGMTLPVRESLTGRIDVILRDPKKNNILFEGSGLHAGIEVVGDVSKLVTTKN